MHDAVNHASKEPAHFRLGGFLIPLNPVKMRRWRKARVEHGPMPGFETCREARQQVILVVQGLFPHGITEDRLRELREDYPEAASTLVFTLHHATLAGFNAYVPEGG